MSLLPSERADWYAPESINVELHRVMHDLTFCETMLETVPGDGPQQQQWRLRAVDLQERITSLKQALAAKQKTQLEVAGTDKPQLTQVSVMGRWAADAAATDAARDDIAAAVGYKSFLQNREMKVASIMQYTDRYVFEILQGPEGVVACLVEMFGESDIIEEAYVLSSTQDPSLFLEVDAYIPSKVCRLGRESEAMFNLLAEKIFIICPYTPLEVTQLPLERRGEDPKLETSMKLILTVEAFGIDQYVEYVQPECIEALQRLLHEVVHRHGGEIVPPCGMSLSYLFDPLCLRPVVAQCLSIIREAARLRAAQGDATSTQQHAPGADRHLPLLKALYPIMSLHCDVFTRFTVGSRRAGVFSHEQLLPVCLGEGQYVARDNLRCAGRRTSLVVSEPIKERLEGAYTCFGVDDGGTTRCYGIKQADGVDLEAWEASLDVLAPRNASDDEWDPCHGAGGGTLSAQGFPVDEASLRPLFAALDPEKRGHISRSVLNAYLTSQDVAPGLTGGEILSNATRGDAVSYDEFCLEVLRFVQR